MGDNFLADLHRAITHGKVEVWVSVREAVLVFDPFEDTHPTSYYVESFQDIFNVVWEDLKKYIEYDEWEMTLILEEIIVDGVEYWKTEKSKEEIWQIMKNGKKVELKFGWFYA